MRTPSAVRADIEASRDALLLADMAEDWPEGDRILDQLRALWDEYAALPHGSSY